MGLNIYLSYNGTAEAAMNFYKDAIEGATIENIIRFGDHEDMPMADGDKDKIMHASMKIHSSAVMFSDGGEQHAITMGNNFSMSMDYDNETDIEREFNNISAGGTVTMPLQETFWGAKFGMCVDKFGLPWLFNHDRVKEE